MIVSLFLNTYTHAPHRLYYYYRLNVSRWTWCDLIVASCETQISFRYTTHTRDEHSLVKTVWNETYSRYVLSVASWIEETSRVKPECLRLCCWNQFKDILRRQFAMLNELQLIVIFLARIYFILLIPITHSFPADVISSASSSLTWSTRRGKDESMRNEEKSFVVDSFLGSFSSWKWEAGK